MLSLTRANGISIISMTACFVSIALVLNVENGTQVGICLENNVRKLYKFKLPRPYLKIGKKSTQFAAGEPASTVNVPARSAYMKAK
jgi:hypothetical protein